MPSKWWWNEGKHSDWKTPQRLFSIVTFKWRRRELYTRPEGSTQDRTKDYPREASIAVCQLHASSFTNPGSFQHPPGVVIFMNSLYFTKLEFFQYEEFSQYSYLVMVDLLHKPRICMLHLTWALGFGTSFLLCLATNLGFMRNKY